MTNMTLINNLIEAAQALLDSVADIQAATIRAEEERMPYEFEPLTQDQMVQIGSDAQDLAGHLFDLRKSMEGAL
jgi:hypothetical protein